MAGVTKEIIWKDFDYRFIAHPITGKLTVRKNSEAIKQAFKMLILTNLGERPYRPALGSSVRAQLFENFTAFTQENITHAIKTAAQNYESRLELIDINYFGNPDKNELGVTIIFRPLNSIEHVNLTINLERIR